MWDASATPEVTEREAEPVEPFSIELSHSVEVEASPSTIYALVSDVARIGELSPECIGCWWTAGEPGKVGSRFIGRNQVGTSEWEMECEVVVADSPSCFAWSVLTEAIDRETSVWRFDITASGAATVCVQTFRMKQPPTGLQAVLEGRTREQQRITIERRRRRLDQGMRSTLAALKAAAERSHSVS